MLTVSNIQCLHDRQPVIEDLNFHVNPDEISCLLGPSGCGKTTALRAIAGFQPIARGEIRLLDRTIASPSVNVPPEQRQVGMVFQDYALFPHLNVYDNIAFGIRKHSAAQQRQKVNDLLQLVQLEGIAQRYPHELSGGQQQRVALARAMANEPKLLLLDEPFSNLDVDLRKRLNLEVRALLKDFGIGAILVTHDQEEAFAFGDHIGLLHDGRLQQWDTPFNLYHEPCNRFVADFIGKGSFIPGLVKTPNTVATELGELTGNRAYHWQKDTAVDVLLRPDDITIAETGGINATVTEKIFFGSATLYTLRLPTGSQVEALFPSHVDHPVGEQLPVVARVEHLIAFKRGE